MFIKKALNEKKKCLQLFNKKAPLYAGLGSRQKSFSKCQVTYQKELCLLFENQAFFYSQRERTDRRDPPSPFPLLRIPPQLTPSLSPSRRMYFLNDPKLIFDCILGFFRSKLSA